jgi:hypothetical protein|tara:strand:- start:1886 stop:3508 length:1623 start_codon:yes stop_codon:yes gene_type:complete
MAITGFAEGALAGFGAVNKFYGDKEDRRLRKEQQDSLAQYRQQTVDAQNRQADLTAKYRADTLGLERDKLAATIEENKLAAERQKRQDKIAGINATASELRARAALLQEERISKQADSTTGMTPQDEAAVALQKARTDDMLAQTAAKNRIADLENGAIVLNQLRDLINKEDPWTADDKAEFDALVDESTNLKNIFDVGLLVSQHQQDAAASIADAFQGIASGASSELSREQIDAFGSVLQINSPRYIGQAIDDRFVNAPDRLKDGNHEVVSTGLFSASLEPSYTGGPGIQPSPSGDAQLHGRMFVMVRNRKTGEEDFYFPHVTDFRDPSSQEPLNITLGEVGQATAGYEHMRQSLTSDRRFTERVRQSLIQAKFGDRQGGSGQEEFDKFVQEEIESINNLRSVGDKATLSTQYGQYFREGEDPIEAYADQQGVLRRRIEDVALGTSKPSVQPVDRWLEASRKALAEFRLPVRVGGVNNQPRSRPKGRKLSEIEGLEDLATGEADPNKIAQLSSFFESPTQLKISPEDFKRKLEELYGAKF